MLANQAIFLLLGKSLPMPGLIYLFVCLVFIVLFNKVRQNPLQTLRTILWIPSMFLIYLLVASFIVAPILAIYSKHLSAFGLDMHQHIYWGLDVYDKGFIPLNERFTNILSEYPKGFHYLSSIWVALGLNVSLYSVFVKMMPFYQALLFCLVILELISIKFIDLFQSKRPTVVLFLMGGVLLVFYSFFIVKIPYPVWDLLGTPRFSSVTLSMTPLLLFYLGYFLKRGEVVSWSVILFPFVCAFLLTLNPVLLVLEFTFVFPLLILHFSTIGRKFINKGLLCWPRLLISIAFSIVYLMFDPWMVSKLPVWNFIIENGFGYLSLQKAISLKIASEREFLVDVVQGEICFAFKCLINNFFSSLWITSMGIINHIPVWIQREYLNFFLFIKSPKEVPNLFYNFLPFKYLSHYNYFLPFIFLFPASAIFILGWINVKNHPDLVKKFFCSFITIWGGIYMGAGLTLLFTNFIIQFDNNKSFLLKLLSSYLSLSGFYLGPAYIWLLMLIPTTYGLYNHFKVNGTNFSFYDKTKTAGSLFPIALVLITFWLSQLGVKNQKEIHHSGWIDPIHYKDIKAVHELNLLTLTGNVAIPANHNVIGGVNFLLPEGFVTSILPFVKLPTVFHLGLNKGIFYSWRDYIDLFCSEGPKAREEFRKKAQIKYLLVRFPGATANKIWEKTKICQKYSLKDFDIKKQPAFSKNGIILFEFESPL